MLSFARTATAPALRRRLPLLPAHSLAHTHMRLLSVAPTPPLTPPLAAKFAIVESRPLPELGVYGTRYRHTKTGAEIVSLRADDDNKAFGVAFRTPPSDSTGVAHILEHSVLCGSRAFPLKEPFVELIKSSLQNFLNAMTYPDRTVYPVASQNLTDFYNLVHVYLDAVFHPLLSRQVFEQEGWHYEARPGGDGVFIKGVVFNEMKGVYSSPDSVNHTALQSALFPDTLYAHSSGGDPAAIPSLTYANFTDFHAKHYHPSNALLFFYGDDDEAQRLSIADSYLDRFEAKDIQAQPTWQPKLPAPVHVRQPYPCGGGAGPDSEGEGEEGGEEGDNKHFLTVGWVLNHSSDDIDDVTKLGLTVLNTLMLGTNSAPLKKALLSSGLGEAVTGYGFEDDILQATFSVGLKGITQAQAVEKVEPLVLATLRGFAAIGFTPDHIASAVNTIEFHLREFSTDADFPKGVSLLLSSLPSWVYGRKPLEELAYEETLAEFKKKIREDPLYFQGLIKRFLLENTHRATLHLYPDPALKGELESAEGRASEAYWRGLDTAGVAGLAEDNKALLARQSAQDSPEALKCIPTLKLTDLASEPRAIPRVIDSLTLPSHTVPLLIHDQPCNGVAYLRLLFDIKDKVPPALLPLLPLYTRCLTQLGTMKKSELPEMLGLVEEVLMCPQFHAPGEVAAFVRESVARHEAALMSSGLSYAMLLMGAGLGKAKWTSEQMAGLTQLKYCRALLGRIESDWDGVLADLRTVHAAVVSSGGLVASMTGDAPSLGALSSLLPSFVRGLPASSPPASPWLWSPASTHTPIAITLPTHVNYVAKAGYAYPGAAPGSADVISSFLSMAYLWEHIRVQGGAYGSGCSVNRFTGVLGYHTYRDPGLARSLGVFDGVPAFLRELSVSEEDITKAIISTIGSVDAPLSPDTKGVVSTTRYLLGITDADVQQRRNEILSTSRNDFAVFAAAAERVRAEGRVAVIASPEAVQEAGLPFTVIDPSQ